MINLVVDEAQVTNTVVTVVMAFDRRKRGHTSKVI